MQDRRAQPRTHYIHRISYTVQERMVGVFVLLAVSILVGLLLSSSKTSNLFKEHIIIYGELNSVQAINKDIQISVSGLPVGSVSSVDITDDNRVILTMSILKKYHNLIREDSTAKLGGVNLAMVQKTTVEITAGSTDQPVLKEGSTLLVKEAFNIKEILDKAGPIFLTLEDSLNKMNRLLTAIDPKQLSHTVEESLNKIDQINSVVNHQQIASMLNGMQSMTTNMVEISNHLRTGKGIAGQAMYDEELQASINNTTKNMELASIKINTLLDSIKQQVDNVPELLEKIGPLLNEADKTIKATQSIWPLSSAVKDNANKETLVAPGPAND